MNKFIIISNNAKKIIEAKADNDGPGEGTIIPSMVSIFGPTKPLVEDKIDKCPECGAEIIDKSRSFLSEATCQKCKKESYWCPIHKRVIGHGHIHKDRSQCRCIK